MMKRFVATFLKSGLLMVEHTIMSETAKVCKMLSKQLPLIGCEIDPLGSNEITSAIFETFAMRLLSDGMDLV